MNRFLIRIGAFIPVCVFIYIVCIIIWGLYMPILLKKNFVFPFKDYGNLYTRLQEAKQYRQVNILFIGSSHAYRGIDTRLFSRNGKLAFNLGSSSQTPVQSEWLLKEYLEKIKPDTVIIEVYPKTFELDGIESTLDIIANEKFSIHSFALLTQSPNIKVLNALIYSAFRTIFKPNVFNEKESLKGIDGNYIKGGYVETDSVNATKNFYKKNDSKWNIKEKQMDSFIEMIDFLKEKKISYFLVQAPITKSLFESYSGTKEFDSVMESFGPYINFNGIPLSDSLHFYDDNHLNKDGVRIFNIALIDSLKCGF